ncbi:Chromatin modification-related protein png1 [Zancudomyces culisetae]|uniref:Chromatin modification-related protein n=1 Tax=Zancudomyces culisetae TaxID=1213189 RepID=A0A1R1PWC5_ZANCU|nr:Chromatin modification-related protein png1 [Zancudomyces culisetae]|eukprot:OMH85295.1 Chromatin modification-related protein png1 [Zancudomyces culisetae]
MVDISGLLNDAVSVLENIPSEIKELFGEIKELDEKLYSLENSIERQEKKLQAFLSQDGNKEKRTEEETKIVKYLLKDYNDAENIAEKKIFLASKALVMVEKHMRKIDLEVRRLDKEEGLSIGSSGTASGYGLSDGLGVMSFGSGTSSGSGLGGLGLTKSNELGIDPNFLFNPSGSLSLKTSGSNLLSSNKELDGILNAGILGHSGSGSLKEPKESRKSSLLSQQGGRKHRKTNVSEKVETKGQKEKDKEESGNEESDDQLYCFCRQVSFGDMVACDSDNCPYEWFHYECVGLTAPPVGSWYCSYCRAQKLQKENK